MRINCEEQEITGLKKIFDFLPILNLKLSQYLGLTEYTCKVLYKHNRISHYCFMNE